MARRFRSNDDVSKAKSSLRVPANMFMPIACGRRTLHWAALVCLSGCGGGIETADVNGMVTLDGKPLSGVIVQFEPSGGEQTKLPTGTGLTNAQGRYVVFRPGGKPGAVVGQTTVRVLHGEGGDLPSVGGRPVTGAVTEREIGKGSNVIDIELRSR